MVLDAVEICPLIFLVCVYWGQLIVAAAAWLQHTLVKVACLVCGDDASSIYMTLLLVTSR